MTIATARLPSDIVAGRVAELAPTPRILRGLDEAQAKARLDIWRASDPGLDALLRAGVWPPSALRRFALAHWSAGNPRLASVIFATAAALAPASADIWLDLGGALNAINEPREARLAFERSLALDPSPSRGWLALALVANGLGDRDGAEGAFAQALDREPTLGDAAFGLALVAFDARRYDDAAARFRRAVELGAGGAFALVGLGQSLFFLGDFSAAAEPLAAAVAANATDPSLVERAALARYLAAIGAGVEEAERLYVASGGGQSLQKTARAAFRILSAYGRRNDALALAAARLADDADPEQRYLSAAVAGQAFTRAPDDYLVAHFDAFAEVFDAQLVSVLGYRAPDDLMDMVDATGRGSSRALDLGCGTGLAGARLRLGRERLVGVDLAPRMLDKARERGCYDALAQAEMVAFLHTTEERFDLVLAADALVYLGELAPLFAAAARATSAGAMLAFNIETTSEAAYRVQPSGRFAHDLAELPRIAAPWFRILATRTTELRSEASRKIEGALVVMERRGARPRSPPRRAPATLAA